MQPHFLTTAQATIYCGFKTTGALRKAHLERRIFPVGRRGGTGTWMWRREDLDGFLRGERPATVRSDRPGAPQHGDAHGKEVDQAVEDDGSAHEARGRLDSEEGRTSRADKRDGPDNGPEEGDQESAPLRGRGDGLQMAERRADTNQVRRRLGPASGSSASPTTPSRCTRERSQRRKSKAHEVVCGGGARSII